MSSLGVAFAALNDAARRLENWANLAFNEPSLPAGPGREMMTDRRKSISVSFLRLRPSRAITNLNKSVFLSCPVKDHFYLLVYGIWISNGKIKFREQSNFDAINILAFYVFLCYFYVYFVIWIFWNYLFLQTTIDTSYEIIEENVKARQRLQSDEISCEMC